MYLHPNSLLVHIQRHKEIFYTSAITKNRYWYYYHISKKKAVHDGNRFSIAEVTGI